ncbi:hypothetical protein [Buttiauxella sp. B2]|nr:hypothetical protein [Buttiauxella sp. B2]
MKAATNQHSITATDGKIAFYLVMDGKAGKLAAKQMRREIDEKEDSAQR